MTAKTTKPIKIVTPIPGPRSRELSRRRDAACPRGAARLTPIAVEHAHGALVTDVDGNQLVDLAGGIGMLATGHTPEPVVSAIKHQVERLIHFCSIVGTHEPTILLAEKLNETFPGSAKSKCVFMNSGAEAVETAVHIARSYTKRQGILVFDGAYHGRTSLTLAMTSKFSLFKHGFGPFPPEVYRLPFPNPYRRPDGMDLDTYVQWETRRLEHGLTAVVAPEHLAAIVVEPVQGEGGFVPAPEPWLQQLRKIADDYGIVLIADEVQSGMGRTGKLWSIEHSGVAPDLITTAKALAAGVPISAVLGRTEIMDAPHAGGLGGTYAGSPLSCAAAIATLEQIKAPEFLDRARSVGHQMRGALLRIQADYPDTVGEVRGVGPMLAIEIVTDRHSKRPWPEGTVAITTETLSRGVVTIRAGLYSNCVRFLPPLTINDEELAVAMAVVHEAVGTVHRQRNPR